MKNRHFYSLNQVNTTKFHVVDSIMGSGKTEAIINMVASGRHKDSRYIIVAPYLSEIDRYVTSLKAGGMDFIAPHADDSAGKHYNFEKLLKDGANIVTSHSIFQDFDNDTKSLIEKYNYVLIIDEVPDVIQPFVYDPYMIRELEQMEKISVDGETGIISWISPTKKGFGVDIMNLCKSGRLMYNKAADAVYLIYPFDLFCAFTDVYISTYMFDAQPVGYYFKYYGFEYDEWIPLPAVDQCGDIVPGKYELVPKTEDASVNAGMHYDKLIHICDNEKMNAIGNSRTALSTTWYLKVGNNSNEIKTLKKNMKNFFRNIHGSPAGNNLWTVVKSSEKVLRGDGYSSNCFISMTARGTNEYSNRHCVAYMANRFMNPYLKRFFASVDIKVDEDRFALSEMLQVIWRSAIRNGEEIQVYIPSKRMRTLLEKWIADHSYGNNDISSHQKNGNAVKLGNGKEKNKQIQKRPRQRGWHVEN